MQIKPEMVDYIRTMIRGDHEANDRIEAKLDELGWDNFSTLLGAVFYYAVNRHFNENASRGEIIGFVAEMRASVPPGAPEIDANAAETMIRAALDPSLDLDVDPEMTGRIQGIAILRILGHADVTEQDLESLFQEAIELVHQM